MFKSVPIEVRFNMSAFLFVFLPLVTLCNALYSSNPDVIKLTESNFDKLVTHSDDVWVVQFYAPWCGPSKKFAPEYSKVANGLKGILKVGACDGDETENLRTRFGIESYPTVKIFGNNKKPTTYNGPMTAPGVVEAALKAIHEKVNSRLGIKTRSKKSDDTKAVVELTDSNFDSTVLDSEDMWLVEFFAPWCGHCKNLEPHWAQAAAELKGKVKLGALDATAHNLKASEYHVKGYPTIKFFAPGAKDRNSAEDYTGGRTASEIVSWALDKLAENIPAPNIRQIVDADTLKEACEEKPLCVIAVLPHILDCQSSCRSSYIDTLQKMGDKYKKKMWGWVWSEAGAQSDLESALDIGGFGYPAMAVLNAKKMKYSILRGSFSSDGINEFLRDLSYGRGSTAPIKGAAMPNISKTDPWDGKDGELPQEEDIDLSDVDLGDEPKDEL